MGQMKPVRPDGSKKRVSLAGTRCRGQRCSTRSDFCIVRSRKLRKERVNETQVG